MRSRLLWLELAAIGLGLVLIQLGALAIELRSATVTDWFFSLAPLIWVNISVLFVYALVQQLYGVGDKEEIRSGAAWDRLRPDFEALRRVVRRRGIKLIWFVGGIAYAIGYMLLQGILVVDPTGSLRPGVFFIPSPVGYGPAVAWSPVSLVGLLLRPYTLAAAVALSLFSGLVLALFATFLTSGRRHFIGLSGPIVGLGVICPACIVAPATGLLLGYIAPAATLVGLSAVPIFHATLALSTALLALSLLLLWVTISWLSRMLAPSPAQMPSAAGSR